MSSSRPPREPQRAPNGYEWRFCTRCSDGLAIVRPDAAQQEQTIGVWCHRCRSFTFLVAAPIDRE